jgi:hypothetical protein
MGPKGADRSGTYLLGRRCRRSPRLYPHQRKHGHALAGRVSESGDMLYARAGLSCGELNWTGTRRQRASQDHLRAQRNSHCRRENDTSALTLGTSRIERVRQSELSAGRDRSQERNILALSSADASPPYGFMLLPGTSSSGFAMKRSSFSSSHTKSAPFSAPE